MLGFPYCSNGRPGDDDDVLCCCHIFNRHYNRDVNFQSVYAVLYDLLDDPRGRLPVSTNLVDLCFF